MAHHLLWRAAGVSLGVVLLALAAKATGFLLAAPFVPWAAWIAGLATVVGVLLWAVSIWTGRAPDGLVWPGRPTSRPHRPVWAVGVWFLAAGWALTHWSASRMSSAAPPTVATLLNVSAALMVAGGLLVGLVQWRMLRSWDLEARVDLR